MTGVPETNPNPPALAGAIRQGRARTVPTGEPMTDPTTRLERAVYDALRDFQQTADWPQLRLAQMRQHLAEAIARDVALTPGAMPAAPVGISVNDLAHALDNSTPYPVELTSTVARYMAERMLEMLAISKRPEHPVWQPEEQPEPGEQPQPEDPASAVSLPPANQTAPSRRAGLRDEIVKALGKIAPVPPVAYRREQADHVLAVLYREWPWLRAEADDAPPADQTALRDRIARALAAYDLPYFDRRHQYEVADAVLAVLPATPGRAEYDALVAEADRLRRDGAALHAKAVNVDTQLAELQKQVAAPVDRAAVLHEAADVAERVAIKRHQQHEIEREQGALDVMTQLRRMADETPAAETECPTPSEPRHTTTTAERAKVLTEIIRRVRGVPTGDSATEDAPATLVLAVLEDLLTEQQPAETETQQPRRGDQFEAWLKRERDDYASDRANDHTVYDALDDLLDRYRLHADTGTPLGGHVGEARVVGDCECLEQPATGVRQDETAAAPCVECSHPKAVHGEGDDPVAPGQCADCPDDEDRHDYQPAVGARQDGAQQ